MDKRNQDKPDKKRAQRRGPNDDPDPPLSARGTLEEGRTDMGRNARSRTEKYGQ